MMRLDKLRDQEIIIYNQRAIDYWVNAVQDSLPHRKAELVKSIREYENKIQSRNKEVDLLHDRIKDKKHTIAQINGQIALLEKVDGNGFSRKIHKENYNHFLETSSLGQLRNACSDLEDDINKLSSQIRKLNHDKTTFKERCDLMDDQIRDIERDVDFYETHITCAERFISDLHDYPKSLCHDFSTKILNCLVAFNTACPRYQSVAVRKLLVDAPKQIECIITSVKGEYKQDVGEDPSEYRVKYLLLCGLLFDLFDRINDGRAENKMLTKKIRALFNEVHIEKNGDLPDDLSRGRNCMDMFAQFKLEHEGMSSLSDKNLEEFELKEFQKASQQLNLTISNSPSTEVDKVVNTINKLANQADAKNELKFLTVVLSNTNAVLLNPEAHLDEYERLAKLADRAPSNVKKMSGGLLASTGTAVAVYAGISAKSAAPTYSKSTLAIVGAAGALALGAGICFFRSGKRQELSCDMMELARVTKGLTAGRWKKGVMYARAIVD